MDGIQLSGDRVTLRPWQRDDKAALMRHADNEAVAQNMADVFPHPYGCAEADAWIELSNSEGMQGHHFAVVFEGEAVGGIGYTPRGDIFRNTAQVGYWIGESHWGKALAPEALALLTEHVFDTTDIVRIEGITFVHNPASGRVLEKCGYALESRRPRSAIKRGETIDTSVYVKLRPTA